MPNKRDNLRYIRSRDIISGYSLTIDNTHPYGCETNHVRAWFSTEYKSFIRLKRRQVV